MEPNSLSSSIRLTVCWVLFLNEESRAGVGYDLMLRVGTSNLSWGCTQELVPGLKMRASWGKRSCCALLTQAGKLGSGGACLYHKGGLAALVLSLNVCNGSVNPVRPNNEGSQVTGWPLQGSTGVQSELSGCLKEALSTAALL